MMYYFIFSLGYLLTWIIYSSIKMNKDPSLNVLDFFLYACCTGLICMGSYNIYLSATTP